MNRSTKYVALDVHRATTVASVRQEGGRVIARTILPTEAAALLEFVASMRGAVHVAFEEGTQAQWLHDLLVPRVTRVVVCDRRGEPRQGNKGDRVDADALSELLRRGALRAVYHGNPHHVELKELTRAYQNLVEDWTRVMLRQGFQLAVTDIWLRCAGKLAIGRSEPDLHQVVIVPRVLDGQV